MTLTAEAEDFFDYWKVMVDRIDRFIEIHARTNCLIVFSCKAGIHRSVALTNALVDIFKSEDT